MCALDKVLVQDSPCQLFPEVLAEPDFGLDGAVQNQTS